MRSDSVKMKLQFLLRAESLHNGKIPNFFCEGNPSQSRGPLAARRWPISGAASARGTPLQVANIGKYPTETA